MLISDAIERANNTNNTDKFLDIDEHTTFLINSMEARAADSIEKDSPSYNELISLKKSFDALASGTTSEDIKKSYQRTSNYLSDAIKKVDKRIDDIHTNSINKALAKIS